MALSAGRLGHGERATAGIILVATVPAGQKWLLRDGRVYNGAGVAAMLSVFVQTAGGSNRQVRSASILPEHTLELVDAFVVLEAGDKIFTNSNQVNGNAYMCGHKWNV